MACEVEWIPLGDIVNLSSGGTPDKKQPAYWDGEIPWISAKTLTGDTVTTSNLFITEEGLHAGSKLAPVGSILLLTRGSGLFKRIPLAIVNAPVAYNQDVKCMTSKVTTITNEYVFFALKALSPELTNMLETTGIGAGKLATDRLLDMPIPVLSHDEREKAVSFFSALSRKIMINNRINDYLADLCETIAGKYCNDRNSCLRDICYQVTDHVDYGNANQETYVSTESLMQNKGGRQLASSLPTAGKITRYKAGDTLISNIRPYFKKYGMPRLKVHVRVMSSFLERMIPATRHICMHAYGKIHSLTTSCKARREQRCPVVTKTNDGVQGCQFMQYERFDPIRFRNKAKI